MSAHIQGGDETLHQTLRALALQPVSTPDDRARAIAELLQVAGSRREPLEAVRGEFQRRLMARSDDFEATHALRLVEGALVQAAWPAGPWPSTPRRRRRNRRRDPLSWRPKTGTARGERSEWRHVAFV